VLGREGGRKEAIFGAAQVLGGAERASLNPASRAGRDEKIEWHRLPPEELSTETKRESRGTRKDRARSPHTNAHHTTDLTARNVDHVFEVREHGQQRCPDGKFVRRRRTRSAMERGELVKLWTSDEWKPSDSKRDD